MHIGSQLTDLEPFRLAYRKVAELTEQLRADGHEISRLDLGGGLGIPYARSNEAPPLPTDYGVMVREEVGHLGCEIEIEPGAADFRQRGAFGGRSDLCEIGRRA